MTNYNGIITLEERKMATIPNIYKNRKKYSRKGKNKKKYTEEDKQN